MNIHHPSAGPARRLTRCLGVLAVGVIACTTLVAVPAIGYAEPAAAAVAAPVRFASQIGGVYDGMPVFNGNPDDVDAYLDTLLAYVDLEGAVRWANGMRGDYTIASGPNAGGVVPGASLFDEGVQGISTDFPAAIGMGQTWNDDLIGEIGEVIGDENLYQEDFLDSISTFNPMVSAALQDIRINPLSGRLDEGIGEDPALASRMIDEMSRGISGIDEAGNDDGFWTKAMVDTKHYTSYLAQWFRFPGNSDVTARALMEYYSRPAQKGIESGAIGSILTTYGRTNGVPNSLSPLIKRAQDSSRWGEHGGLYTVPDNGADRQLPLDDVFSNGFDRRYSPSLEQVTALMMLAEQGSVAVNSEGGTSPLNAALIEQIENGTYGVTRNDVYEVAGAQILPLVRMGLFNERDADGYPKYYPFLGSSAASAAPLDATVPEHQDVALRAAEESLVLLKNDRDTLPLSADADLAIAGPMSDTRFRTTYAAVTPELPDAGLTPTQGIRAEFGDETSAATDGNVVAIKSVATGKYLTHDDAASPSVFATGADQAAGVTFESFAWGQGAYGYRSTENGQWLQFANDAVDVGGTQAFGTSDTALPYRIRPQSNADGTMSFIVESFSESFLGGFETRYYTNGRYLTVDPSTGRVGVTAVLGDEANAAALNTDATKFQLDVVQEAGSETVSVQKRGKYAVVVVGAPARHSSGEGADRSDLRMGADQYQLIENVADAYPRKTIVVVSSSYPVALDEVEKNNKVAAIVQAPYNGQYGNLALGKLLSGEVAPTGRLTQTWYEDTSALPPLDDYSIPEGTDARVDRDGLDPRFTVDMTNGDPVETDLTYMYTDAPVTYEFGHGLSYSTFDYRKLRVEADSPTSYTATLDVRNTGRVDTSEVVQLYASNPSSAYGDAVPERKLVGFDKVQIPAGETRTVSVTFDAENLAVWDTTKGELTVEAGRYQFEAGGSSDDIEVRERVRVPGTTISPTDAKTEPVNVFDRSFVSSDVTYRESSKQNTVNGLREDRLVNGYHVVMSRAPGAWTAINDVDFTGSSRITLSLASQNPSSTVEVRLDRPNGRKVAEATLGATGSTEYLIPGATAAGDIPVAETAFRDVVVDLDRSVRGSHDLYVVFAERDIRIRDLQLLDAARPVPAAPAAPSIGVSNDDVNVTWTAPADNGSPVTGYDVTLTPTAGEALSATVSAPSVSTTFPGVVAGTYRATVVAKSAAGSSPASPSSPPATVTDSPPVPMSANARSQCVNGKAAVAVYAQNDSGARVDVRFETPSGSKRFTGVAAGAAAYSLFDLGATRAPAGAASIAAYTNTGGVGYYSTYSVPFTAVSCG